MISILPSVAPFQRGALDAAAGLAVISLSSPKAWAFVVTVNSVQYDVTTFTGSYDNNASKFTSSLMPWYGDLILAQDFVAAVG